MLKFFIAHLVVTIELVAIGLPGHCWNDNFGTAYGRSHPLSTGGSPGYVNPHGWGNNGWNAKKGSTTSADTRTEAAKLARQQLELKGPAGFGGSSEPQPFFSGGGMSRGECLVESKRMLIDMAFKDVSQAVKRHGPAGDYYELPSGRKLSELEYQTQVKIVRQGRKMNLDAEAKAAKEKAIRKSFERPGGSKYWNSHAGSESFLRKETLRQNATALEQDLRKKAFQAEVTYGPHSRQANAIMLSNGDYYFKAHDYENAKVWYEKVLKHRSVADLVGVIPFSDIEKRHKYCVAMIGNAAEPHLVHIGRQVSRDQMQNPFLKLSMAKKLLESGDQCYARHDYANARIHFGKLLQLRLEPDLQQKIPFNQVERAYRYSVEILRRKQRSE